MHVLHFFHEQIENVILLLWKLKQPLGRQDIQCTVIFIMNQTHMKGITIA